MEAAAMRRSVVRRRERQPCAGHLLHFNPLSPLIALPTQDAMAQARTLTAPSLRLWLIHQCV